MPPMIEFRSVSKSFKMDRERPRAFQDVFISVARRKARRDYDLLWALRDVSFII